MTNQRNPRLRRGLMAALVGAVALSLSACVSIPSSGPVITGREVSELEPGLETIFTSEGPAVGDNQEAILRGFISAFSNSDNYETARMFLATGLAEEWDPRASVLVRNTGAPRFNRVDPATMEYSIVTNASVDRDGSYTSFASAPQSLRYQFVQEGGEWRISAAPDGIVLTSGIFDSSSTSGTFAALFSEHSLYFLDPTRRALVPDLRWFPNGTAATRIVSALLDGPPPWLQGAVGTAFPDGTQLTSPKRVPVESDVAVVDLTTEAIAADESQRQLMRVQLRESLRTVSSIRSVDISVEGTPMSIPPPDPDIIQSRPQVDSRMLVLKGGEFGYLANNKVTPIEDLSGKIVATKPRDATLGSSGTVAVTLGEAGVFLVRARSAEPLLVDTRPGLIAPSLDDYGYIWSAQAGGVASIRVIDSDGTASAIQTTLPGDEQIVSLEVSRDGARVAILLATDDGPRLVVAAIIRDPNGNQRPVSLGEPRLDILIDSGAAIDATWVDELSVAILTKAGDSTAATLFKVGGKRTLLGNPGDAVAIVGGNNETGIRVLGADGLISVRRGSSGWQSGQEASFIATQR